MHWIKRVIGQVKSQPLSAAVFAALFVFYGSLVWHQIRFPASDDLGRHIKNGELILQGDWRVFSQNLYSYTEPDAFFANHHWLFGVLSYVLDQTVGFKGMVVAKVAILLTAFSVLFATARKRAGFWTVAACAFPTILLLMERGSWRPETISYLFFAIFLYVLTEAQDHPEKTRLFWLIPLQLLWVNTHIFFVFGVLIAVGFTVERLVVHAKTWKTDTLLKKYAGLAMALALASVINPHGIAGATLQFPLNIKGDSPIAISEDTPILDYIASTQWQESISAGIFVPLVLLLALSFVGATKRKSLFYLAACTGATLLTFLHIRAISLFALFFLPAMAGNIDPWMQRAHQWIQARRGKWHAWIKPVGGGTFLLILGLATVFNEQLGIQKYRTFGVGVAPWSNAAGEFFHAADLKGPVFNDADVGSYLIYHLYPQERVFADNRFGDAYSSDFWNTYISMIANESVWKEQQERYGFDTIFFYQYDGVADGRGFLTRRMKDPEWAFIYADTFNVIFIRNTPENQEKIKRLHITSDNAEQRLAPLLTSERRGDRTAGADILFLLGRRDLALKNYLQIVTQWPETDSVWMVMGQIYLQDTSPDSSFLGVLLLERALAAGRKTAEVYAFLGLAYLRLDQLEKGQDMLKKSLEINPDREDAKSFLQQLEARVKAENLRLDN